VNIYYVQLFTTDGENNPNGILFDRLNTVSDYDNDDYSCRLLAPTMTTLLQQQARGISSGSSYIVEKGCHLSGRPTLSYPSSHGRSVGHGSVVLAITSSLRISSSNFGLR